MQSDLYGLGLILYETYAGKPASAAQVAAALPGGDPMASAAGRGRRERWRFDVATYSSDAIAIVSIFCLVMTSLIARHNVRLDRGDRRGARRVTACVLVLGLISDLGPGLPVVCEGALCLPPPS